MDKSRDPATGRLLFIAGPCIIESESMTIETAQCLKEMTSSFDVDFVFKASFDKANRTSIGAFRGPGIEEGLRVLAHVKHELKLPVLSDIHEPSQAGPAAEVLDYLQIPAFLCRQTDLVVEAARTMKPVNIKKGQFLSPQDMRFVVDKAASTGNRQLMLTERGVSFGYNTLVVDFRSLSVMAEYGYPVVFDATHSVQIPSQGGISSGNREYVQPLARAAAAYGIDGLFCEVHPNPPEAKSDGANSLYLHSVPKLLREVLAVRNSITEGQ